MRTSLPNYVTSSSVLACSWKWLNRCRRRNAKKKNLKNKVLNKLQKGRKSNATREPRLQTSQTLLEQNDFVFKWEHKPSRDEMISLTVASSLSDSHDSNSSYDMKSTGPIRGWFAYLILSYLDFSFLFLTYFILSHLLLPSLTLSFLTSSYLISSFLILFYLIWSYLILSYLILSWNPPDKTM